MTWFRIFIDYFAIFVLPLMIVGLPIYGLIRGVKVYEEFVEGAKEGFRVGRNDHPLSRRDSFRHRHVPGLRGYGFSCGDP